jgi:hypothetical protein
MFAEIRHRMFASTLRPTRHRVAFKTSYHSTVSRPCGLRRST